MITLRVVLSDSHQLILFLLIYWRVRFKGMADTALNVPKASVKRIMKTNDDVSLLSAVSEN